MSTLLRLFFLWRQNTLPSIVFKSLFWGVIAWLVVGIFTSFNTALLAGAVFAGMQAIGYGLKAHKQNRQLLQFCKGDKERYKALKAKASAPSAGGFFMSEILREAVEEDMDDDDRYESDDYDESHDYEDDDDELYPRADYQWIETEDELSALAVKIEHHARLNGLFEKDSFEQALEEARANILEGDEDMSAMDILRIFFKDQFFELEYEDYRVEGEHVNILQGFATASNGLWQPENITSRQMEDDERWEVAFTEKGKPKKWRFTQAGAFINERFLNEVMLYAQAKTGWVAASIDSDSSLSIAFLPHDMALEFFGEPDRLDEAA